jgi:hypothetical protein
MTKKRTKTQKRDGPQMKKRTQRPHIKAAARDAAGVSIVRGGRRFRGFVGRQQLAEGAPVSGMPFCGFRILGEIYTGLRGRILETMKDLGGR